MHHITTGAGNDIERPPDMARKMVLRVGMSELGPMSFGKREEQISWARDRASIAITVRPLRSALTNRSRSWCRKATIGHARLSRRSRTRFTRIALALLEREVLDGAEVHQLIAGETLRPFETAAANST